MKLHVASALAGLILMTGTGVAVADEVVVIKPEQETVIREYVKKQPLASIKMPGIELNVGSTLPDTVELRAIDVPDVKYRYVVVDDQTVLVDPGTRRIVRVLN